MMMKHEARLRLLERRKADPHEAYERSERERLEAMTEAQLLQHIARGLFVCEIFQIGDGDEWPHDFVSGVDALTAAGDIARATALVDKKWAELNLTEV